MKKISKQSLAFTICSLFVAANAHAAGTYYTGSYQSPQYKYGSTPSAQTTQYKSTNNNTKWPYAAQTASRQVTTQKTTTQKYSAPSSNQGFYMNGGISREVANWNMEMTSAGSILHYDNISWNVLDVNAGYNFGSMKLDAGIKYGMQASEGTMIDDDITNGGYWIDTLYWDDDDNPLTDNVVLGDLIGQAVSVGTSDSGSMFGFNLGLSFADKFQIENIKLTPSIGYRHFSYSLETKNNHGLSMQTGYCVVVSGSDETQCIPTVMIDEDSDGIIDSILWNDITAPAGDIYMGDTFLYKQPGTSHKYDTSWSGPYVAMDMDYEINKDNLFNARFELGLPAYNSKGDQPYRPDWEHPTSVEDSAGIGDAWHFGLGANWMTALNDRVNLSFGFTYDYYSVSGAQAKTMLNQDYYDTLYWNQIDTYYSGVEQDAIDAEDTTVLGILALQESCPNWVCTQENEIDSYYKSMGIRIGLSAKF